MAKFTNYYIKGKKDGKKTRVFEKDLHKATLAAKKIGLDFKSEDAYGYDPDKKKWVNVQKALKEEVKKTSGRAKTAKDLLNVPKAKPFKPTKPEVSKLTYNKLVDEVSRDLPSTLMGAKNYNKVVKEVKKRAKVGDFKGVNNLMKSQLQKIERQVRNTPSHAWVEEKLKKYVK